MVFKYQTIWVWYSGELGIRYLNAFFYLESNLSRDCYTENKTGLQPVSRPVELVHYSEGWGVSAKSLVAKTLQTVTHTEPAVVPDA